MTWPCARAFSFDAIGIHCEKRSASGYVCAYQDQESPMHGGDLDAVEFKLVRLHDSQFQSIAHLELRSDQPLTVFPEKVEWEVTGGRYHILETELPAISYFQPFQRTVLFKEKVPYHVVVKLLVKGVWKEVSQEVELMGLEGDSFKPVLDLDKLEARLGEKIKLWGEVSNPEEISHVEWEVRRLSKSHCLKAALSLEDSSSIPVRMALERVCGVDMEETLSIGEAYDLISSQFRQGVVQFKTPGKF